jgi:hypothetical protein
VRARVKTVRATVCLLSVVCVVAIDTLCYKMLGIMRCSVCKHQKSTSDMAHDMLNHCKAPAHLWDDSENDDAPFNQIDNNINIHRGLSFLLPAVTEQMITEACACRVSNQRGWVESTGL